MGFQRRKKQLDAQPVKSLKVINNDEFEDSSLKEKKNF
jgi:hypothetical protein